MGDDLADGFQELIAHREGSIGLRRTVYLFHDVDVKVIREQSGLSQIEFAKAYGFNPRTLQEWEQGRAGPESAVLAYLKVIAVNPEGVRAALDS